MPPRGWNLRGRDQSRCSSTGLGAADSCLDLAKMAERDLAESERVGDVAAVGGDHRQRHRVDDDAPGDEAEIAEPLRELLAEGILPRCRAVDDDRRHREPWSSQTALDVGPASRIRVLPIREGILRA